MRQDPGVYQNAAATKSVCEAMGSSKREKAPPLTRVESGDARGEILRPLPHEKAFESLEIADGGPEAAGHCHVGDVQAAAGQGEFDGLCREPLL